MSDFTRQPNTDFPRRSDPDFARQSDSEFNRQSNADLTRPANAFREQSPAQPNVANEPARHARLVNDPTVSRPTPVSRGALTTTGPIFGANDIAAFIAAAVMVLGPLAAGAFSAH
jgi:hypothetical protein